jgi:uncharacterized protein YndB with AHSA1/START domain
MTTVRVVRDYPHPPARVWRALTDPDLMALWGMRPEGFSTAPGTRFRLVARPNPRWRGYVECELLEARAARLLRYRWDAVGGKPTTVTFTLEPTARGTRVTLEHAGFTGVGGWLFARMLMVSGWKGVTDHRFPAVLADLNDDGTLRPGSTLRPLF